MEPARSNIRPDGHMRPERYFRAASALISWADSNRCDVTNEQMTSCIRHVQSCHV